MYASIRLSFSLSTHTRAHVHTHIYTHTPQKQTSTLKRIPLTAKEHGDIPVRMTGGGGSPCTTWIYTSAQVKFNCSFKGGKDSTAGKHGIKDFCKLPLGFSLQILNENFLPILGQKWRGRTVLPMVLIMDCLYDSHKNNKSWV